MERYKSLAYTAVNEVDSTVPDNRNKRSSNFDTFNNLSGNFKKRLLTSLSDYMTYAKETSTSYVSKPFDVSEWAQASGSADAQAILDAMNTESNLNVIQQYYDMYMSSQSVTDKKYRIGDTIGTKNTYGQVSTVDLSGQLEDDGSMYTNVGFRLSTSYANTNGGTETETYSSLFFPPYVNKASTTISQYLSSNDDSGTFDCNTVKSKRFEYTLRTPAFKSINDNIMFWQYILEGCTGIVSTYLTEWDLSLYIQEGLITHSAKNPGVLWLLNRIQDDNPLYTDRYAAATFGVLNAAMSQVYKDNELLWYPGLYPYSNYWVEYPRAYNYCSSLGEGVLAPNHYHVVEKMASTYPSGHGNLTLTGLNKMGIKDSLVVLDQIGAACSGYDSEWILPFYRAVHTTEDSSLSQYDVNQMNYIENGNVDDMCAENADAWQSENGSDSDSASDAIDIDGSASIPSDYSSDSDSASDISILGVKLKGSSLLKMFLKRNSYKSKAMSQASSAGDSYTASDYLGTENQYANGESTTTADKEDLTAEQIAALEATGEAEGSSSVSNTEKEGSHTAITIGVPQRNPVLFGGPHGMYLSPKVPQAFFENDNPFLRNYPHGNKGTYMSNGVYYNSSPSNVVKTMYGSENTSFFPRDRGWTPADARNLYENGYRESSWEKIVSTVQHRVFLSGAWIHWHSNWLNDYVMSNYFTSYSGERYGYNDGCHYEYVYPTVYYYNGGWYHLQDWATFGDDISYLWQWVRVRHSRRHRFHRHYWYSWEWQRRQIWGGMRAFYFYTTEYTYFKRFYIHDASNVDWYILNSTHWAWSSRHTPVRSTATGTSYTYLGTNQIGFLQIDGTNTERYRTNYGVELNWTSEMDYLTRGFGLKNGTRTLLFFTTRSRGSTDIDGIVKKDLYFTWWPGYKWLPVAHYWYSTEHIYYTWYTVVCGNRVWHSEWRWVTVAHLYYTYEWVWVGWAVPTIETHMAYDSYYAPPGLANGAYDLSGTQVDPLKYSLEQSQNTMARVNEYQGDYPKQGHGILGCLPAINPNENFVDTSHESYKDKVQLYQSNGARATADTSFRDLMFKTYHYWYSYNDNYNIYSSPTQVRSHTVGGVPVYYQTDMDSHVVDYLRKLYSSITWYMYGKTLPSWASASAQGPLLHALCLRQMGFLTHLKALMQNLNWKAVGNVLKDAVDSRVYKASDPSNLTENKVYYNVWISQARQFFDSNNGIDTDVQRSNFENALDIYVQTVSKFLATNNDNLHRAALDYSFNRLDNLYNFVTNIGNSMNTKDFAKYLFAYMNILYEYRKYFINKRCNKSDGTLTMVRNLEKVLPAMVDYVGATQKVPDFGKYTPGTADGDALDVVFYRVQNTASQKNQAAKGEIDALGPDRILKVYIPVEFATIEDYNNQASTGKEVIKTSLGEYVFKPADGTYYLSSKEYQANLANENYNAKLSEENKSLAKTVDDTIDYCETVINWGEVKTPIFRGKTSSIDVSSLLQNDEAYSEDLNPVDVFCSCHSVSSYWTVDISAVAPKAAAYLTQVQIIPKGTSGTTVSPDDVLYAVTGVTANLLSPVLDNEVNTVVGTTGVSTVLSNMVSGS